MAQIKFSNASSTSSAAAVRLDGVSKAYRVYPTRFDRVREALDPLHRPRHKDFHALHDVSAELPRGATVGILGVNGSGKSTLLQIICGIIPATAGTASVDGRIAALIELGAGFNPDMTGRENVTVNGVIMGMSQSDIKQRMPQIEAFAEIGEFFDQPLKMYSSGMTARVGFAMAIHVDPDVLVIDEALAVGDARFQQKCFKRFRDFQDAGKTILFVTHDRFSLPRLCTHGMVLHAGRLVYFGDPKAAMDVYGDILISGNPSSGSPASALELAASAIERPRLDVELMAHAAESSVAERDMRTALEDAATEAAIASFSAERASVDRCALNPCYNRNEHQVGIGGARIVDYMLAMNGRVNPPHVTSGGTLAILLRVAFDEAVPFPIVGFAIKTKDGVLVFETNSMWRGIGLRPRAAGDVAVYRIDVQLQLGSNDYFIDLAVASSQTEQLVGRQGVCHIRCDPDAVGHGIVSLQTSMAEVERLDEAGESIEVLSGQSAAANIQ
jgi:lipopolysaccharide transport system ATP-binding protein